MRVDCLRVGLPLGSPETSSCWSVSSPRKITSFNLLGIIYNWISEGQTPEGPWPDSHSSSPRDASLLRARVAPLIHFLLHFLGCVPRREKGVISSATSGILSLLLLPYFNSNMAALESKVLRVGYYALTVEPLTSCFPCSSKTVERKLFFFMSIHFCAWRSVGRSQIILLLLLTLVVYSTYVVLFIPGDFCIMVEATLRVLIRYIP